MKKIRLFLENFLIYGLSSIIGKLIPLFMVPIVTRLMPDSSYFGINDMSGTIRSFAGAIASIGMYDAMSRMFFEREEIEYKKKVCSMAFIITLVSTSLMALFLILFRVPLSKMFYGDEKYSALIFLVVISMVLIAFHTILETPTRMQNKRKTLVITSALIPILSYTVSIPLLLKGYYLIALLLAGILAEFAIDLTYGIFNRRWFGLRRLDFRLLKEMLMIGIPLIPNFLIYWVFNSCDKIMITYFLGVSEEGVYSVGSKLGHMSQLIYSAFSGGWLYFSYSTMKEKNQIRSNAMIFEYMGIISFAATAFVFAWCSPIYSLLFTKEYVRGYIVSPYLFLAPLLQMLFQIAGTQFLISKKSWPHMILLSAGAVVNILLNIILIPKMGIEGAAIATLCGYVVSLFVCVVVLIRIQRLTLSGRFLLSTGFMTSFILIWRSLLAERPIFGTILALLLCATFGWLYQGDIFQLLHMLREERTSSDGRK